MSDNTGPIDSGSTSGGPITGGGRAMPDFGPLARGSVSGGDTLYDGGGEDQGAPAGNQNANTGSTETGSMGVDTAALGGGAATVGDLDSPDADPTGSGDMPTVGGAASKSGTAQGEGVR